MALHRHLRNLVRLGIATLLLCTWVAPAPAEAAPRMSTTSHFDFFSNPRPHGSFAYAPASVSDGAWDYHFYCGNAGGSIIVDRIYLRRYHFNGSSWSFVDDQQVLAPSAGKWDSKHVCDPTVTKGSFNYNGTHYQYAMFYTGTKDPNNDGTQNQVGMAVSNDLVNWVKRPSPVVTKASGNSSWWGVGQPSATSVSGGSVLLLYTRFDSLSGTYARQVNFSNVTSPTVQKAQWKIPHTGLQPYSNGELVLHAADFAYDSARDRFYVVRPADYSTASPSWVTSKLEVAYISGSNLWNGIGSWSTEGVIDSVITGHSKNFDGGLQRNVWGGITNTSSLRVNVSVANAGSWPAAFWSYHVHSLFTNI